MQCVCCARRDHVRGGGPVRQGWSIPASANEGGTIGADIGKAARVKTDERAGRPLCHRAVSLPCSNTTPSPSMSAVSRSALRALRFSPRVPQYRRFSLTSHKATDGVFRALTESRVQTPWIEALRRKQRKGEDPSQPSGKSQVPADRKLEPKKMSDSYHRVVSAPPGHGLRTA